MISQFVYDCVDYPNCIRNEATDESDLLCLACDPSQLSEEVYRKRVRDDAELLFSTQGQLTCPICPDRSFETSDDTVTHLSCHETMHPFDDSVFQLLKVKRALQLAVGKKLFDQEEKMV